MKNRNLVIVILAVICAGLLAGVVYTVTKGKSGTQKKQEASAEAGADETESQSGIIEEDGKKYKLNPDIKTVLFMGVDKEEKADLGNNPGENGQSDSLNLLVLNKEEKTAQIIQISRDSMVGIDIYDVTGNRLMTENGQIALQYAYGDGAEESCRLTSEKVSELMYGVNVDSYFSLTLEGLVVATDAVGGITLTVPEDYTAVDPAFEKGAEVTLNGELAEKYVRKRDIEVLDSNNQRMERQSQFMDALIEKMQSIQSETEYLSLYQKLEDYMTTNMTADEMEELTDYKVAEDTVKVPGEIIEKDGHAQYLVDNNGNIDFPVLGTLHIGGLTKSQAENMIKEKLKTYIKENPIVNVRMTNYKISVMGEVAKPGTFTITNEKVNIMEALAMAGDMTVYGQRNKVKLIREDAQGNRQVIPLNLNDADIIVSPYYYLQQNDVVYVTPNKTKAKNASISNSTTIWFSVVGTLVALASLIVTITK